MIIDINLYTDTDSGSVSFDIPDHAISLLTNSKDADEQASRIREFLEAACRESVLDAQRKIQKG